MNDYNTNLINNFWDNDIWKINYKKIYNDRIKEIITNIIKLEKKLFNKNSLEIKGRNIININQNYEIEIINENNYTNIEKEIFKLKKDNLNYFKKHVECIPEYHFLLTKIINYKIDHYNINLFNIINYNENNENNENNKNNVNNKNNENNENNKIFEIYEFFIKKINIKDEIMYKKIANKLKSNIEINIDKIEEIIINKNKKILILDTENLLKSIKIQYLLKKEINNYDEIFKIWNNGNLYEFIEFDNNITLSEYSNNTSYIEPYMSLSLSFKEKYEIIKIFVKKYLIDYYTIYTISSKNYEDFEYINSLENQTCIPIFYNKEDIREQDDHLICFLTYYLNMLDLECTSYNLTEVCDRILLKDDNIYLISNDKFRWLDNEEIDNKNIIKIKNFIFLYDYDEKEIKLKIMDQDSNDIIKIDNKLFVLGYNNFPIITNINNDIIILDILDKEFNSIEDLKENLFIINYDILKNDIINDKNIIFIINKVIEHSLIVYNNLKIIFLFLKNNTKNSIFNYNINMDSIIFSNINTNSITIDIQNYKILCEIYIILKTINLKFNDNEFIFKICKLYSIIILIYDNIHDNLSKIRKLSNNKTEINKLFLELHCTYLYLKKIGIMKKNI